MILSDSISDYVKLYKVFDSELCRDIIKVLEADNNWQKHHWYSYTKNTQSSLDYDASVCYNESFYNELLKKMVHHTIREYIDELNISWFQGWKGFSNIRYNKYDVGTKMNLHCDHIHSIFDGQLKGIPTLSVLGSLNSDYTGGDFLLCGEKITINTGEVLVFPSNFMYPHEVTTVNSGTRYTFVTWVY